MPNIVKVHVLPIATADESFVNNLCPFKEVLPVFNLNAFGTLAAGGASFSS
jgi:hypothetical protein